MAPPKIFLAIAEVFALIAILFYIKNLEQGFRNQFQVAVQIEKLLGISKRSFFGPEEEIYPAEWEKAGTKQGKGSFFQTTYLLLYLGAALLLFAIGSSGLLF